MAAEPIAHAESLAGEADRRRRARVDETRVALALGRRAARASCARRLALVGLVVLVLLFAAGLRRARTSPVGLHRPATSTRSCSRPSRDALVRHDADRRRRVRADAARHAEVAGHRPARRAVSHRRSRRSSARSPATSAAGSTASLMWVVDLLLVLPGVPDHRDPVADVPRQDVADLRAAAGRVPVDGHRADRARHDASRCASASTCMAARYMGVPGRHDHLPPHPAEHVLAADHRRDDQRQRARSSPRPACPTSASASSRRTSRSAR